MTEEEARAKTIELFGYDSFTEFDDEGPEGRRFYVGQCPKEPGTYPGFMGYSWEEALDLAKATIQ